MHVCQWTAIITWCVFHEKCYYLVIFLTWYDQNLHKLQGIKCLQLNADNLSVSVFCVLARAKHGKMFAALRIKMLFQERKYGPTMWTIACMKMCLCVLVCLYVRTSHLLWSMYFLFTVLLLWVMIYFRFFVFLPSLFFSFCLLYTNEIVQGAW